MTNRPPSGSSRRGDGGDGSGGAYRRPACAHRTVHVSRLARIEQCEHGTVHLVLGDLTLRLQGRDFTELAQALAEGATRLEAERAGRAAEHAARSRLLC